MIMKLLLYLKIMKLESLIEKYIKENAAGTIDKEVEDDDFEEDCDE